MGVSRGFGQKVIAFSFYDGKKEKIFKQNYFEGIAPNVQSAMRFYPGWVMRLYLDLNTNQGQLKVKTSFLMVGKCWPNPIANWQVQFCSI